MNTLSILLDEVRGKTIALLEATPDDWLLFAPQGTQNHITWHAGHCAWLGDVLLIEPTMTKRELPIEWTDKFGMNATPPDQTKQWPSKTELLRVLRDQHKRLRQLLSTLRDEDLSRAPKSYGGSRPLAFYITHGLHDEANHQGEMYLLLKLRRARDAMT